MISSWPYSQTLKKTPSVLLSQIFFFFNLLASWSRSPCMGIKVAYHRSQVVKKKMSLMKVHDCFGRFRTPAGASVCAPSQAHCVDTDAPEAFSPRFADGHSPREHASHGHFGPLCSQLRRLQRHRQRGRRLQCRRTGEEPALVMKLPR